MLHFHPPAWLTITPDARHSQSQLRSRGLPLRQRSGRDDQQDGVPQDAVVADAVFEDRRHPRLRLPGNRAGRRAIMPGKIGAWLMEFSAGTVVVCLAAVFLIAFMRG